MDKTTLIKGLEQGRAKSAYERADKVPPQLKEKFKSHVKSFPMLVIRNGLGAAIAFLFSKGDKEQGVYRMVGESIVEWLKEDEKYTNYGIEINGELDLKNLSKKVTEINSPNYRALTIEILAFFNWLRRFADGL